MGSLQKTINALTIAFFYILVFALFIVNYSSSYPNITSKIEPTYSYNFIEIKVPAIINETYGEVTNIKVWFAKGEGRIFVNYFPIKDEIFQLSLGFSKMAVCSIFPDECNNYDYLVDLSKINTNLVSGPSGSLAISLAFTYPILMEKNASFKIEDYAVTGFVLPSGVVLPVGGIDIKEKAAVCNGEKGIILPIVQVNNTTRERGVGNILEALEIFYGYKLSNNTYTIPKEYESVLREIAIDICKHINDSEVKTLLDSGKYYSAASLCFGKLSSNASSVPKDVSIDDLRLKLEALKQEMEYVSCDSMGCYEVKYAVLSRINESLNALDKYEKEKDDTLLAKAYWRYVTAKKWKNFLKVKYLDGRDLFLACKMDSSKIILLQTFLAINGVRTKDIEPKKDEFCLDYKEIAAKYEMIIAKTYLRRYNINLFLENLWEYIEKLLSIYGPSINALNYLEYSKTLRDIGDIDSSLYYAFLALYYAEI